VNDKVETQPVPPLGRKAAGGAFYIGASQAARALLAIATTMVVARILSPADYGVIAMWAPTFAFVLLFQDLGFSAAAIQSKTLSREQSSTLFWTNIGASLVIALLLTLAAPLIGVFYNDSRVASVTAASASIVLIGGLAIQHTALLNRDMKFRQLAFITLASALASITTTVGFALYLKSYWALFFGNLASVVVQTIMTWVISRWRPGRRASLQDTRKLLELGAHVATFGLLNFFARNADNVLIGRFWGPAQLGAYDRSYKLMVTPLQLVNAPLSQVMLPVLSRLRDEPERFRKSYLFSVQTILLVTAPAAAVAVAESDKLVLVLLGPKWSSAAPIFFWLALAMVYQPVANSLGWLFISCGRGRAFSAWGAFSSAMTVISFVVGLSAGAVGVARAYVLVNVAVSILAVLVATKGSPVKAADVFRLALPSIVAVAISWLLIRSVDQKLSPIALIILSLPASYLVAFATVLISPHGRQFFRRLVELIKTGRLENSAVRHSVV
jgi:PST family polysaccharide transporter